MRLLHIAVFGILCIVAVKADICSEKIDDADCVAEDFAGYEKCIKAKEQKRTKRQAACPYAVVNGPVPCQQQYTSCMTGCQSQLPCQQSCVTCDQPLTTPVPIVPPIYITYPPSQPLPQPQPPGEIRAREGDTVHNINNTPAGHNITTIIHLNNMVNNTNIINMPTNLNTTNVNHINIINNATTAVAGGKYDLGKTEAGSCCYAVQPKTCRKTQIGSRCQHRRHKTCGSQCTARVIHVQSRRKCDGHGQCHRRRVHIPQPAPQRCVQTRQWPYASCGGRYQSSCGGCYDHYGRGYEGYYGEDQQDACNGCYDDGFDMGPLYRRGPVLRRFNYHEPPCAVTGYCEDYYHTPYGYYGHDRVDPAFPEYSDRHPHYGYEEGEDYEEDYIDEDGRKELPEDVYEEEYDGSAAGEESLGVEYRKCKVVEDDGSFSIKNCTSFNVDNPYFAAPVQNVRENNHHGKRKRSHPVRQRTRHRKQSHRQFPEEDDEVRSFKDDDGEFVILNE